MWAFHASDAAEDHIRGLESMKSKGASNVVLYEQQCKVSGKKPELTQSTHQPLCASPVKDQNLLCCQFSSGRRPFTVAEAQHLLQGLDCA